jgi:thioesterase domain-containing protein
VDAGRRQFDTFVTDLTGSPLPGNDPFDLHDQLDRLVGHLRHGALPEADYAHISRMYRVFQANAEAARAYVPQPFHGAAVYVEPVNGTRADEAGLWRTVAPGLTVRKTPGDHTTMVGPEHAGALALTLAELADQAELRR